MSRLAWLLFGLLGLLLIVLWWFLLWSPTSDEIEQVRADTEVAQNQTATERAEAARLRQIRESAPEAEGELARGQVIVPDDPALPALLRQIQQLTDDAGVTLLSVAPGRPSPIAEAPGGLAGMSLAINIQGTYFQVVDLARRMEDPSLIGRGLVWGSTSISPGEYPILSASLTAEVFTRVPVTEAPPEEPTEPVDGAEEADPGDSEDPAEDILPDPESEVVIE